MEGLLPLDAAREAFRLTEPLAAVSFSTGTEEGRAAPVAVFGEKWAHHEALTDPVEAWLTVPELGGRTFQMTFQAALELGSTCHINQAYQQMVPPEELHQRAVQWWLSKGLGQRRLKLLLSPEPGRDMTGEECPLAVAQTRDAVTPFLNGELLDTVVRVLAEIYGEQSAARAGVHVSLHHDLEHTDFRVFLPEDARVIRAGRGGEEWLPGVEVTNSCIGLKKTTVTGALRRAPTAGVALDLANAAGGFKRRNSTPEQAYEWAAEAAGDVLGRLDEAFHNVAEIATRPVGEEPGTFAASLCDIFRVPRDQVETITTLLEEYPDDLTMYALAGIAGQVANDAELGWRTRSQLMAMAGHVVHSVGGRCTAARPCFRAYGPGFDPPGEG